MAIPCKLYPTPVPPAMYHVLGGKPANGAVPLSFRRAFGREAHAEKYVRALNRNGYLATIVKVQS